MSKLIDIIEAYLFGEPAHLPALIAGLAVALLIGFLGYRMQRAWGAILGFLLGASIGVVVAERLFKNDILTLIVAVVAGFFVGMLAYHIYAFGMFLFCFFCAAAFAAQLAALFVSERFTLLIIMGAVGLIVAVLCVIFLKPAIIADSALFGGFKAAQYGIHLIPLSQPWLLPALAAGLVAVGAVIQFLTTKNYKLSRGGDRIKRY